MTETAATESTPAASYPVKTRKKLIEVTLPLEAINAASAREKSIRHGHPSTLHLWWARRPLAAARAVIFSQMVDDPSEYVDVLRDDPKLRRKAEAALKLKHAAWEEAKALAEKVEGTGLDVPPPGPEPTLDEILADHERQRLFRIIEQLVQWENTTNETVLQAARDEIWASWRRTSLDNIDHPRAKELFDRHTLPAFHDPFAGGGALPLEAQRLGLEAYASDLNPVAVLINKAMIEIPPKFAARPPVNPESRAKAGHSGTWKGAAGLAEDIRYYGKWMRDEAERRIGYLYPKVEITPEMAKDRPDLKPHIGQSLTVVAWIWARTVFSPNPAFGTVQVPLATTFMVSKRPGNEAYVKPILEQGGYRLEVRVGSPSGSDTAATGTSAGKRGAFRCLMSGAPITYDYIREQGAEGRLGSRLLAIVAEGGRGHIYLSPTPEQQNTADRVEPTWRPEVTLEGKCRVNVANYGLDTFGDLFSDRQTTALDVFSALVAEARARVQEDSALAGSIRPIPGAADDSPMGYADAVAVFLGLGIGRSANYWSGHTPWGGEFIVQTFGRQAIPMVWDHAEANPFSRSTGNWMGAVEWIAKVIEVALPAAIGGVSEAADAQSQAISLDKVVSTDPPYYDNISYADLSDFFYVWLRRALRSTLPELFGTVAVPKGEELVATPYRHGTKQHAASFFLEGMTRAMARLSVCSHAGFPITIYYAFKQAETTSDGGTASTGWETFLDAVLRSGLGITGTWPMRTERDQGLKTGSNVLASSIVLVCRRRPDSAPTATRREFFIALKSELPRALADLQRGNIAPVDLQQAAIGPGMAVFTRYEKVIDAAGKPLSVRDALALINEVLDESLAAQEGDFDADSRWSLTWYEQYGFEAAHFGTADQLSKSKNTSVSGMVDAGILESGGGKVRLLKPSELDPTWDPAFDRRRPAWQSVHQLILAADRGEAALADLIAKLGTEAETARELAYRLYVVSERKKRTTEAGWYNGLVQSWQEAVRLASNTRAERSEQTQLFGEG